MHSDDRSERIYECFSGRMMANLLEWFSESPKTLMQKGLLQRLYEVDRPVPYSADLLLVPDHLEQERIVRRIDRDDLLDSRPVSLQIRHQPFSFGLTPLASTVVDEARGVSDESARRDVLAAWRHVWALDELWRMRSEQGVDEVEAELADFEQEVAVVRARDIVFGGVAEERMGCGSNLGVSGGWTT